MIYEKMKRAEHDPAMCDVAALSLLKTVRKRHRKRDRRYEPSGDCETGL